MEFSPLNLYGTFLVHDKIFQDDRGIFTETWEKSQFKKIGVNFTVSNSCFSYNKAIGTLRGLHYQEEPYEQSKIVTCAAGSIFDVIVDLRKDSATYLQSQAIEITAFKGVAIYIPKGCAHGFVTLENHTVVNYLIEGDYVPNSAKVIRYNDPLFAIKWPGSNFIISKKDLNTPDFNP
jgi:dTDP-4-dehydrorhamnose 3,5-epimerase